MPQSQSMSGRGAHRPGVAAAVIAAGLAATCFGGGQTPESQGATFENQYVTYRISGDGRNASFICKRTGKDYCAQPGDQPFVSLKKAGVWHRPTSCRYAHGRVSFGFEDARTAVTLKVTSKKRYFVFEVESVSDPGVEQLRLANLMVKCSKYVSVMSGVASDGEFAACLRALNLQLRGQISERPAVLACSCYRKYRLVGAKFALLGCPAAELRDVLKEVVRNEGLPYSPLGGPWALDAPDTRGSYVFAFVTEKNVEKWIELAKLAGLTHIHMNGWYQSLGHYEPRKTAFPHGLSGLKAVVDKIHAAGLKAGMHTLTGCIQPHDSWVTPVPDKRLATDGTFTLAAPLDMKATTVLTEKQPDNFDTVWGYGSHGNVIRIGDELVQYSGLSRGAPYGFTDCKRGAFGTRAAVHAKGAAVGHLFVRWGCFHPDENSTLVDDIADAIARVFNTCGFDMIYMDGVTESVHGGWHGAARIRRAIFERIKRPVLVEASCWDYHSWPFHSRLGAWDHPRYGVKRFVGLHCRLSEPDIDDRTTERFRQSTLLPAQLGWWAIFGPTRDYRGELPDEIEYLCAKALGHDAPLSFQAVQVDQPPRNARRDEYLTLIGRYERLRLAGYFSESVKARLRKPGEEFRLIESSPGIWQFVPTDYAVHKVTGLDNGSGTWTVANRFGPQPVKLRIEALYSVEPYDSENGVVLADFSTPDEFSSQAAARNITHGLGPSREQIKIGTRSGRYWAENKTTSRRGTWAKVGKTFVPELDIDPYDALGVWVHGDGKGELLNLQLTTPPQYFHIYDEHYVKIDFRGWRYFELLFRERDADAYSQYAWPYGGHSAIYRSPLVRRHVNQLNLYFNNLPPEDHVTCYLSPIKALRTSKVTLRNPVIEIGGRRIIFPVEMESGAYLEFESNADCRVYDERGMLIRRIEPQGERPDLAGGENQVHFCCEGPDGYCARANVTVVSHGKPFGGKRL